ncbi:MAG: hypothetical protein ABSF92_02485 [Candidatus Acidiferrales bacterium]
MHSRMWMTCILSAFLAAMPALAKSGSGKDATTKGEATQPAASSANTSPAAKETSKESRAEAPASPSYGAEIEQLREMVLEQAKQLEAEQQLMREQQEKLNALTEELRAARTAATAPAGAANSGVAAVASSGNSVSVALASSPTAAAAPASSPEDKKQEEGPAAIHVKGVTITPGGFFVAESVWRQKALSADVNTPFTSVPFSGATQARIGEFNASGRQSRISLLVEGKLTSMKLTGYEEADFLSAGVTSNDNQSNSFTLRQRQMWGQAATESGWTFTGGQMWSLVTERKKGMDNRTEAAPLTIDAQYAVGFSWARQYAFRVSKNFNNKVWLGFAVEQAQTILGGHGAQANFVFGAAGANGGLLPATNNFSFNRTPDVVVKAAFEPGFGHYEIFGVLRTFRSRIFPCALASSTAPCVVDGTTVPSAAGAANDNRTGGGIGVNARFPLVKNKLDLGVHFLGGEGVGRYGTSTLPDVVARPDGTLALVRSAQGLVTLEWHPTPAWDVYFNGGAEYANRTAYLLVSGTTTTPVGYGSPLFNNSGCGTEKVPGGTTGYLPGSLSNCNGDIRGIAEATFGFWHRIYKGPKGALQWGPQYAYVIKDTWSGVGGHPKAFDNMIFTSFRYYLP